MAENKFRCSYLHVVGQAGKKYISNYFMGNQVIHTIHVYHKPIKGQHTFKAGFSFKDKVPLLRFHIFIPHWPFETSAPTNNPLASTRLSETALSCWSTHTVWKTTESREKGLVSRGRIEEKNILKHWFFYLLYFHFNISTYMMLILKMIGTTYQNVEGHNIHSQKNTY